MADRPASHLLLIANTWGGVCAFSQAAHRYSVIAVICWGMGYGLLVHIHDELA